MKKIINILTAFIIIALSNGCDPIVNETGMGEVVTSADQLVAEVVQDGNANRVHVKCSSPVVCQWSDGVNTLASNEGDIVLLVPGNQTITMTAMAADGKTFTKAFTVNVVDMKYPVDPAYGWLFGTGSKTWVWNTTSGWPAPDGGPAGPLIMCSSAPDGSRSYWGWTPDDMSSICKTKGYPDEGLGAKMVFELSGKKVTKYSPAGAVTSSGSLNFDMTPTGIYGSLGTLSFVGTNILFPYDRNGDNPAWSSTAFTIVYLDDAHLMLFTPSSNGGWYYVFNAQ